MESSHNQCSLPHKVHEEILKEIISNNLAKSFDDYEIIYSSGSEKGDGYIGVICRIQVVDKETNESKLNLIVKLPPDSPVRRQNMSINNFFVQESTYYDKIYPMYKKFQIKKGIDVEKDGFHHIPFCFKTMSEEPHEVLFFEDLKAIGFDMFDRLKEVTKDQVFIVMKTLAKMHALFYSIKDQEPELVEPYIGLKDPFTLLCEKSSSFDPWFDNLKSQSLEVINKIENKNEVEKIKNLLLKSFGELLNGCFDREKTEPYATLCHGDCWNNNMLFKYDKNGAPCDLRLLDFQIIRYASPICDLMYYIFCCTTKSLRDKYYQEFLNIYYDELCRFIFRLGSDPEKLFPRKIFEDHLIQFGKFGLIMAIVVLPIFTSDVDDIPDMEELAKNLKKMGESEQFDTTAFNFTTDKTQDRYTERLIGVCEDMFSLGYI